jgi:hypothetical protein
MDTMPGESSPFLPKCCSHRFRLGYWGRPALLAMILPFVGCHSDLKTSPNYPYAFAARTCAPWDGAAVTIYLTPSLGDSAALNGAHLSISIWTSPTELPGRSFNWPSEKQIGAGLRCTEQGDCQPAAAGRVAFRRFVSDSILEGSFDLLFSDSTREQGGFRAAWRPWRELCG